VKVQTISVAAPSHSGGQRIMTSLLALSDATAAVLLAADLLVVCGSVLLRFLFNAPVEWADDVARGLMVGSSFFGAASALARSENLGVAFFIDMLPDAIRRVVDAMGALLVAVISGYVAFNAIKMGWLTTGQTSGSGLPLEWTFYPMGAGALFMTVFAVQLFCARPVRDMIAGLIATALIVGLYLAWDFAGPASVPSSGTLMLIGFFITLFGGLPIGFALALAALIFIWVEGTLPGALLAASAVMAETIPPCVNLIILGFVANLSIGGLFVAGLLPSALMALALIVVSIIFGKRPAAAEEIEPQIPLSGLWSGAIASFGLIFMIFAGFKSGFATATEISAFAAIYALVIGSIVFRELSFKTAASSFVQAATRSGLVLFIVAAAQSLAFILTLQQVPHAVGDMMLSLSGTHGTWLFMLLSIAVLIVMGSVLEGAAALIIFGPLLLPVAVKLGIDPLHFGVVLVISMGLGLFAPPLGLGLYGACLIGNVPIEQTVKPIMGYLGLLFLCLLVIAFIPGISTALPHAFGY
jgi:tripartite ATP-independent transporter DctM subunit